LYGQPSVKNDRPPAQPRFACPSCGTETFGHFCGNCGEKETTQQDHALRYYVKLVVNFLTTWDSKTVRSVWLLVSRPGYLSREYFRGSKVRYMKPLQLFLSINVVYYFSIGLFYANTFTTPLSIQLHMNDYYPAYASRQVSKKLQREQISYEALEIKYDEKTNVLSRTLIFLLIPIFALLFYALFFKNRKYFSEHVVVATHFWSFNLLLLGVFLPVFAASLMWFLDEPSVSAVYAANDNLLSIFLQVCFAAYLFLMLRRAYLATNWYCLLIASIIAWSFFHVVWLYRYFLFEVTLRSI
jgi:hypothetical protein